MEKHSGDIYWPAVCGNRTIHDALWSWDLTIYTESPDFTSCFQKTIQTWLSCGMLWLAAMCYCPVLLCKQNIHRWTCFSRRNLILTLVIMTLTLVHIAELGHYIRSRTDDVIGNDALPADFIYVLVKITTYVLAAVMTHWCYIKGEHSPGILFIFWFIQLLSGVITFRSKIVHLKQEGTIYDVFAFAIFYVSFNLIVAIFILSICADVEAISPHHNDLIVCSEDEQPLLHYDEGDGHYDERVTASATQTGKMACPERKASFLSRLYFGWFFKKVITGYRRTLTYDDVWDIRPQDACARIVPKFNEAWASEINIGKEDRSPTSDHPRYISFAKTKYGSVDGTHFTTTNSQSYDGSRERTTKTQRQPSLLMALIRTVGVHFMLVGFLLVGMDITTLLNPIILRQLISFVQHNSPYLWHGYVLGFSIFFISMLNMLFFVHNITGSYTAGSRSRTALISAIYRKSLRLSSSARKLTTVGEMVNLMSVDTEKIVQAFLGIHFLWSAPLVLIVALYFQYKIIGPSCLMGLLVLFVVIPINTGVLANKIRKLQKAQMKLKDQRLKLVNQVLNGIKVLKLYAWEPYFRDEILALRKEELSLLRKASLLSAATYSLWYLSPFLVALLDFITYTLTSKDAVLDPQTAFTMISLIQAQNFQVTFLPQAIMWTVQARVSLTRLQEFLLQDEIDTGNITRDVKQDCAVKIDKGVFSWSKDERITLKNISLSVESATLVGIVGNVGSGKSSLISALLGEMEKRSGNVIVNGSIAYVPQQAWIQNMTLRDNVLFSRRYHQSSYQDIIKACALQPDLDTLPGGDLTEIGERGINLSGGQKQRVSLARAVYQDRDIYLLDDPLSAVDAHVSKHIFKHVIGPDGLLRNKTRLLVTHNITHLSKMDLIIVMTDGEISEIGTYHELLQRHGAFSDFIRTYLTESIDDSSGNDSTDWNELQKLHSVTQKRGSGDNNPSNGSTRSRKPTLRRRGSHKNTTESQFSDTIESRQAEPHVTEHNRLIEDEKSAEGTIGLGVLKAYLKAATPPLSILTLLFLALYVVALVSTNLWLSAWTSDSLLNSTLEDIPPPTVRLAVYGSLGVIQMLAVALLCTTIVLGSVSASNILHADMLHKIVRCPMSFFDTTPLGRILNRFSKDVDVMDNNIQQYVLNLFLLLGPLITTFVIILYTTPLLIVVFIPLAVVFIFLQRFYVHCSRQIKRIDAVKKSPLYAFFSETLNGSSVIRAYNEQERFIEHSDLLLDNSQKVWFEVYYSNRWISLWAEVVGEFVVLFVAIVAVSQREYLDPSLIALSLTFALQMSFSLVFAVRNTCDLETYIVSVERIQEYTDLTPEADWVIPGKRAPVTWPHQGVIDFNDYSTRYREGLDLVLKDATCHINGGEKVGIVGRTGSGKSSLTLGLFRILEPSGGHIDIDGINISELGLHDVRSRLTIIPQDPVLFSGSVRFNLDPACKYTDQEIWTSLEQAHLSTYIHQLPDDISYECGENGENFSVGQRQLLCLARALLRKTKILILDEATAAVDMETDDLIQATIRSEFKSCTVITIAHRLNTILDYDRVIVMSEGQFAEIGTPQMLLENSQSLFYGMAKDAGLVSN